jgi:hypothetical protein
MTIPRGISNDNPLNLRPSGDKWIGMRVEQTDPGFVQFQTSFHGLRAGAKNLLTYYRVHKRDTVSAIISSWAPPSDNNPTDAYISTVAKAMGVNPDGKIDLNDKLTLRRLMDVMIRVECGSQPYSDAELDSAIDAAYVTHQAQPVPSQRPRPKSPTAKTPPLVDQPSAMPTRKLVVGGIVGACAFMLMVVWNRIFPESPLTTEYATEIASVLVLAVTLITQYFVRNRATDIPPGEVEQTSKESEGE